MKLAFKLMIEFTPLAIFFVVSTHYDPRVGTAVFMAATVVSVVLMRFLYDQVAMMALITAGTGLLAGAVTVVLNDPAYIQMKPTLVSLVFALILGAGLIFEAPLFQKLLGQELDISAEGWRVLTWLWMVYFVFVALINEYIRREYMFETWAAFKVFGLMPLTIAYALPQSLLLRRYKAGFLEESGLEAPAQPAVAVERVEAFVESE